MNIVTSIIVTTYLHQEMSCRPDSVPSVLLSEKPATLTFTIHLTVNESLWYGTAQQLGHRHVSHLTRFRNMGTIRYY